MNPQNIPQELKDLPQWVCRNEAKQPINPHTGGMAKSDGPTTWGTFEQACEAVKASRGVGIGFVLTAQDPFALIDLDVKPGEIPNEQQQAIYRDFQSYSEISPSGRGLHIVVKGAVPKGLNKAKVEIYSSGRYMTMTGNIDRNLPIADYHENLNALWGQLGGKETEAVPNSAVEVQQIPQQRDEVIVGLVCGSPANAAHYNGTSDLAKTNTSEATFALTCAACLFSSDEEQVRRVVTASPLVQNSPPKGSETRAQKVTRLWATEYPRAARRGAQERQQGAQASAHGAQIAAAIGQPALGTTGDGLMSLVQMRTKFEHEPPQAFVIERRIPDGEATLFSGDGGTGKTFAMQQVAVYVATGSGELIGEVDRVSPVLFWTAEDTLKILDERFQNIEKARHVASCGLWAHEGLAHIKCRDVLGAALWIADRDNPAGKPTPAMDALAADIQASGARLVVLDNASNLFQANPNDPVQVTAFATELRRIARENHCAIVLLAHVNAETASTKFGPINKTYSGTVAWNNAFRSRMFIRKVPAENGVPEHVVVSHEKTNYGALAEPVRLKRNPENGVLSSLSNHEIADAIDEDLAPFVEQVFTHMEAAHKRGEAIRTSLSGSRTYYHCLAEMFGKAYPEGDKDKKRKVRIAIERLYEAGRIEKQKQWTNGNHFQTWKVLQPGDPQYDRGA